MKIMTLVMSAALVAPAARIDAQLFHVGVRAGAGIPTGSFADSTGATPEQRVLTAAEPGLGYGLDAGVGLGLFGLYAGYDRIDFKCASEACAAGGNYKLKGYSGGVRLAVPFFPIVKPWVKGGLTFSEIEVDFGSASSLSDFRTERRPGYEVGAGLDIPLAALGIFSLTPQVRYVRQTLKYTMVGSPEAERDGDYYTFDIGLRLKSPF